MKEIIEFIIFIVGYALGMFLVTFLRCVWEDKKHREKEEGMRRKTS